ncbi:hypothetical protein EHS13_13510 [Paenibacillus psychroresistens]|uniref:Uncharacterized protein n=1 Tax=Paenibacillus psychroresistens TaxID=1778678 RepID=A0A6B8RHV1_9BACL|nr:hypothetical protein [Paenibacillus psychroresistens]QGQ95820.1 hypothetical protein EHS13_13510 [Paenibacillus psychroresistens]
MEEIQTAVLKIEEIKIKVTAAIKKLFDNDLYFLINDLNERTITHKLGTYLQEGFSGFDVDCEYNKNVDEENGLKNIHMLINEAEKLNKRSKIVLNGELYVFSTYPDIIVHKRGGNENNLLIIEVKKTTNPTSRDFDQKKLKCYTDQLNSSLKYKYGLFIEFETKVEIPKLPTLIWYENGTALPSANALSN